MNEWSCNLYPSHPERGAPNCPIFPPTSTVFECNNQTHSCSVSAGKHGGVMSVSDVGNSSFVFNTAAAILDSDCLASGRWLCIYIHRASHSCNLLTAARAHYVFPVLCSPLQCANKSVCSPGWRYLVLGFSLHTCLFSLHRFPFTRWCNVVSSLALKKQ